MTTHSLSDIFRGLRTVGLTKGQVTAILPDWWEPEIAKSDAGLIETALLLGRRLSLDANALMRGLIQRSEGVSAPHYKHTIRVTPAELEPATMVASALARAILGTLPARGAFAKMSADSVRKDLLSRASGRVDFDSLLSYCWSQGIPVIPIPNLPRGMRKMDAAALKVGDRPAIVIALRSNSKAWLSFLLAHELGHICLGHIEKDMALIEGSISDSTEFDAESQQDPQEIEANEFAHAVLGGSAADNAILSWPASLPSVSLATRAMEEATFLRTAPGHLILRHAFVTKRWPEARTALNFLADDVDAQAALVESLREKIDTTGIGHDMQEFVEQVTGVVARN